MLKPKVLAGLQALADTLMNVLFRCDRRQVGRRSLSEKEGRNSLYPAVNFVNDHNTHGVFYITCGFALVCRVLNIGCRNVLWLYIAEKQAGDGSVPAC